MDGPLQFTPAAQLIAGLLLLLMGRRLFWLFVALVGFFVGANYGALLFSNISDGLRLLVAVVAGLIGAGLAIVLQRLAVVVAGGIAGGMLAMRIAPLLGLYTDGGIMVAFVAGALLTAVLLAVLFDPALIVISALTGATMVAEAFPMDGALAAILLVILAVVGVLVQARSLRRSREVATLA
jgi:hypothetical protein